MDSYKFNSINLLGTSSTEADIICLDYKHEKQIGSSSALDNDVTVCLDKKRFPFNSRTIR